MESKEENKKKQALEEESICLTETDKAEILYEEFNKRRIKREKDLKESKKVVCTKVCFNDGRETPRVLYGIIIKEDMQFLDFRTEFRSYKINKVHIISIEETIREFRSGLNG